MTSTSSGEAAKAKSRARTSSTPDAVRGRDRETDSGADKTHTWIGVDDDAVEGSSHPELDRETIMARYSVFYSRWLCLACSVSLVSLGHSG